MLNDSGIRDIINTSCPSVWDLTQEHLASIPSKKADNVLFTLTDYNKSFENDKNLLKIGMKKCKVCRNSYKNPNNP